MPHMSLNYDINYMCQVIVDLMHSLWPIIAAGLGIAMAGLLLAVIAKVFRRWVDDEG